MDSSLLSLAIIAFLVGGIVKGVLGMGLPTTAIAILGAALGLREAIPLLIVPALATNIWQVAQGGAPWEILRRFWLLNLCACLGIWLGTLILFRVDPTGLTALLGAVICLYAMGNLFSVRLLVPARAEPLLSPVIGLASGLLTGAPGSPLLPIVAYMQALGLEKEAFVHSVSLMLLLASAMWGVALINQGALNAQTGLASTLVLIPSMAGLLAGQWIRARVPEARFRIFVFGFLFLLGFNLLRKGIF